MIGSGALRGRILQVATALDIESGGVPRTLDAAAEVLAVGLGEPTHSASYLLLSVVTGIIPFPAEVVQLERSWRLRGARATVAAVISSARRANLARRPLPVRIDGGVVVDVNDTARTPGTTGIQRVVRSTLEHWLADQTVSLVVWNGAASAPRSLRRREAALVGATAASRVEIVIPWGGSWVLPEIATDPRRVDRMRSIAQYARVASTAIGHDAIPMTSAETAGNGMPGRFARYLSTIARFDSVAATSRSSRAEFAGFETMLAGAGVPGPTITEIELPAASNPGPADAELVRRAGVQDDATLVLAIGSHEPRKNHLALLQAAELVWRDGLPFTLVIAGGNSWANEGFERAVAAARARKRSIVTLGGASDATVWALYRRARFTVFPSLNEGFGLPVVESISARTPVITADFGSMRESAEGHGGLLVNPRSDHEIASAMRLLLTDDVELERLREETATAPQRSWAQYASELWTLAAPER